MILDQALLSVRTFADTKELGLTQLSESAIVSHCIDFDGSIGVRNRVLFCNRSNNLGIFQSYHWLVASGRCDQSESDYG